MAANNEDDMDDLPPLEDMSEALDAARKMRGEEESSKHDATLYESVVKEPSSQPRPVVDGARIKVHGLVRAAQYNGLFGTVLRFDEAAQKFEVRLESGKELKIKQDNLEVVESFGGLKGGFMKSGLPQDPDVIKPKNQSDHQGPMDQLKSVGASQRQDVPEWMKPSKELLDKVSADNELAAAADNHKLMKAMDEVSKDPSAWKKYQNDPEVVNYFKKMMGLFGQQFEEHEKKKSKEEGGTDSTSSGMEQIFTQEGRKGAMIEEISSSGAAKAKRVEMAKSTAPKPPAQAGLRKVGRTDYSKFDLIDSDDEDEGQTQQGALRRGVQSMMMANGGQGKVGKSDPKVASAMADPRVQRVLQTLRTCDDPQRIAQLMAEEDVKEKIQLLVASGALDIQAPS